MTEATVAVLVPLLLLLTVGMEMDGVTDDRTDDREDTADDTADDTAETPDDAALEALLASELAADDAALVREPEAGMPVEIGTACGDNVRTTVEVCPPASSTHVASPPSSEPAWHAIAALTDA